eukprot:9138027-Heterocapsa_arctica.AAC.1
MTNRTAFIELPAEDWRPGDDEKCSVLRTSWYGTRNAAQNRCDELGNIHKKLRFVKRKSSSSVSHPARRQLKAEVHGDDITVRGSRTQVETFMGEVAKVHEINMQIMGCDRDPSKT